MIIKAKCTFEVSVNSNDRKVLIPLQEECKEKEIEILVALVEAIEKLNPTKK